MGRWRDIEFKPNNSNVIYAAKQSSGGSNIYRTTDGGANWVIIDNGISGSRYRPLIAVTPDNPEVFMPFFLHLIIVFMESINLLILETVGYRNQVLLIF